MKIYSYCRVSTQYQSLDRQEEAVKRYCKENNITLDREFADKISGKTFERKEYQELKNIIKKDDVLIIKELDRFGRSMELIKEEWNYFMSLGVRIIVIDMPLISSDLSGKKTLDMQFISNLVFEVLCYSAEKEREKLSQRTKEALAVKKSQGIKLGAPSKYDEDLIQKVLYEYQLGTKLSDITTKYGVSMSRIRDWRIKYGVDKKNGEK